MAASNAITGYGVILKRNGTAIAEITMINPPALKRGTYEKSHHASPARWQEFGKGLKDGGDVSFDINYIPTNATHNASTGILADFADDTGNATYDIVFPDDLSTTWSFAGIVTEFAPKPTREGKTAASVKIKVAGQPTLA